MNEARSLKWPGQEIGGGVNEYEARFCAVLASGYAHIVIMIPYAYTQLF
jgi:hypothetical protein